MNAFYLDKKTVRRCSPYYNYAFEKAGKGEKMGDAHRFPAQKLSVALSKAELCRKDAHCFILSQENASLTMLGLMMTMMMMTSYIAQSLHVVAACSVG